MTNIIPIASVIALFIWIVWLSDYIQKKMYKPNKLTSAADQVAGGLVSTIAALMMTGFALWTLIYVATSGYEYIDHKLHPNKVSGMTYQFDGEDCGYPDQFADQEKIKRCTKVKGVIIEEGNNDQITRTPEEIRQ